MRIWFNQTRNHDLNFMGGMVSTWNKFCFTGGMVLGVLGRMPSVAVY